jgi:hypothetical protein
MAHFCCSMGYYYLDYFALVFQQSLRLESFRFACDRATEFQGDGRAKILGIRATTSRSSFATAFAI